MMVRSLLLLVCSALLAITAALIDAPHAAADAPGPTDYVTTITGLEPSIDGIELEVIGGDSFILMRVEQGFDVVVLGYETEPYLWFRPDGQVLENRASPATWANQNRFGESVLPEGVSADAPPRWTTVGENGTLAWHDHRSHWMNAGKPLGAEPGDQILDSAIPLVVSGRDVLILVESRLLAPPPWWPAVLGVLVGVLAALAAVRSSRLSVIAALATAGIASLALGYAAYSAVPSQTEPSRLLWLLPTIAVAAAVALLPLRNRLSTTVYLDGLTAAGGGALAAWSVTRFDAIRRALIPSTAPANFDRIVIMAVIIVGATLVVRGLIGLARPERLNGAL